MTTERILKEAEIEPTVVSYHLLSITVVLAITVFGIPLLIIVLPLCAWYFRRHYERLRVVLTARELKVARGIFFREEKSIPLEKITDLAVYDGPIMRHMNLKGIRVETAGQTSPGGALVRIVGIRDTDAFRDAVLNQRDRITDHDHGATPTTPAPPAASSGDGRTSSNGEMLTALHEIRDVLKRIEDKVGR